MARVSFQESKSRVKERREAGREGGKAQGEVLQSRPQLCAPSTADCSAVGCLHRGLMKRHLRTAYHPTLWGHVTGHSGKQLGSWGLCAASAQVFSCQLWHVSHSDGNSTNSRCSNYGDILSYC